MPLIKNLPEHFLGIHLCIAVFLFALCWMGHARAQQENDIPEPRLIPREVLFGNPERATPRISPDGSQLAYLAPVEGVLNVWAGPAGDVESARPVTQDRLRGIRAYAWTYRPNTILYVQDTDGDENWHVYVVNTETLESRNLTPIEGVRAQIEEVSYKFPTEILVGLNQRDPQFHDIYRLDIVSGELTLMLENPGFAGFLTDDDYHIRLAMRMTEEGGQEYLKPDDANEWQSWLTIPQEDSLTTYPIGFDKTGRQLYFVDSRGRNTAALTVMHVESGSQELLAEDEKSDIAGVMAHPVEKTLQAVAFNYLRREWRPQDPVVARDLEALREVSRGDVEIVSRTMNDQTWIAAYLLDNGPVQYYIYDRISGEATFLFTNRPALETQPLVRMHPVIIQSRDGLDLVSYLSLPINAAMTEDLELVERLPMVLLVHGGPWARSSWGYDPQHQWFANRGYAVLDVNFRGSTGFGKEFINAADREWGGKMHDDLIDGVNWAIEQGIADPERVAIYGASYGGYAALAGLTFTPEVFACAVSVVGPSNLVTLLNSLPPYWQPAVQLFVNRVGDHRTEEGREFLLSRSPLTHVERIGRPLLIGQGANDPRVKQAESDQIVAAMKERSIPVTYVLFPDEGHGFARPENAMAFSAVSEAFLAEQLNGRFEEIGDDFRGSNITVPVGAEHVPELEERLPPPPPPDEETPPAAPGAPGAVEAAPGGAPDGAPDGGPEDAPDGETDAQAETAGSSKYYTHPLKEPDFREFGPERRTGPKPRVGPEPRVGPMPFEGPKERVGPKLPEGHRQPPHYVPPGRVDDGDPDRRDVLREKRIPLPKPPDESPEEPYEV